MTIHDVLKLNITKLKEHNIEEPILKAKILLAFVLCKTKEYLLINQNEEINKDIIKIYETNIEKIINGFPIQYITNKKEFMGLDFFVNESVLIPRNDTEILVEESLNIIKKHNMHEILDLCTGSGAIAVSIAKNIENAKIIATDISEEALKIAEKNAMQNEVSKRILFKKSDMFNDIDCLFDLVISNPPYIEEKTRPGEFMEIEEGENHTTILSSRDLQMAEYLHLLQKAGIDSIKIEGRMKSVYYVANTVRVYRILLDLLDRIGYDSYPEAIKKEPIASYLKELDTISRRESDTGFYFGRDNIKPTLKGYLKGRRLMGMISDDSEEYAKITVYNTIKNGDDLVYIGKDFIKHNDNRFKLFIKTEENEFVEVDNIRNIDNAYIKSGVHDFKKYDIITVEED